MKTTLLALSVALTLSGCAIGQPTPLIPTPASYANRTAIDEQVAVGVELGYKAFRIGLETAVDAGLLKGAAATRAAAADRTAYQAVVVFRQAYKTANSTDLLAAARSAHIAIEQALATLKGA